MTHVARDLVKGKGIGDVFNKRKLVESVFFKEMDGPTHLGYADTVTPASRSHWHAWLVGIGQGRL